MRGPKSSSVEVIIGQVERDPHNADGFEHLHFGFRLQAWAAAQQMQEDTGRGMIAGYDRDGETIRSTFASTATPSRCWIWYVEGGAARPFITPFFRRRARRYVSFLSQRGGLRFSFVNVYIDAPPWNTAQKAAFKSYYLSVFSSECKRFLR